jgi:hypothetical protein
VVENRVLWKIFGLKMTTLEGNGEELLNDLRLLNSSPVIIRVLKSGRVRWVGMWHVWRKRKRHTGFVGEI